jgi:hypothetical protein
LPVRLLQPIVMALVAVAPLAAAEVAPQPSTPQPVATGPSVNCILIQNIRSTNVVDGATIDFKMKGGTTYRNTLPLGCPMLGFERAFSYVTSQSRLCSVDLITVFVQGNPNLTGATCGLGKFTPIASPGRK